jgi:hypothetical protein
MTNNKYTNIFALLTAVSLQVSVVWQDHSTPLAGKLASTLVAFLALAVAREKIAEVEQLIVAACVVGTTVLVIVLGHLSASSTSAMVLSVALATFTQVRRMLGIQLARGAVPTAELGVVVGPPAAPPPQAPGTTLAGPVGASSGTGLAEPGSPPAPPTTPVDER